jgi:cobalt-zinc-cadmium efflux system outer membrane protein
MRAGILRLAVATALLSSPAGAQTVSLTEPEALARIGRGHPRVEAARAAAEIVAADVHAAARWPNPRASVSREAVAGVAEHLITVTQPLPVTGRRGFEVSAAEARASAASSRADEQSRRLRADMRLAFARLVAAQARERELAASRDRLQALVDVLARREAAGDTAGFDRLRAGREVIEIEADRVSATAVRAWAQAALWGLLSIEAPPTALVAVAAPADAPVLPAAGELVARAEAVRPALQALQRDIEAATFARRAADRRSLPEPEVIAGTKSSNAGAGDIGSVLGVHIALPLFDRGQPERLVADARLRQATAEVEVLRRELRADIEAWREVAVHRREAAAGYRRASADVADIERIAQVSYDAGERGILDLLDAHRTASAARLRQAQLDAEARAAEIELEYVSGWELP